jgi:hypothetical protein
MCNQNVLNKELRCEIIKICTILMKQNCFRYRDLQYIQEDGLGMGAPTSSFFSEIHLQYLENTKTFHILMKHRKIGYFQYTDDILLVYQNNATDIHVY